MSLRLKVLVTAVVATSMFALVATFFLYPLTLDWPSVMFWIAASIAASAAPVQLPRGTRISVSGSPILAAAFLGGPIAAGVVGAFGSTEWRELRGRVPWYGTLYNHAALTLPAIVGAVVFPGNCERSYRHIGVLSVARHPCRRSRRGGGLLGHQLNAHLGRRGRTRWPSISLGYSGRLGHRGDQHGCSCSPRLADGRDVRVRLAWIGVRPLR